MSKLDKKLDEVEQLHIKLARQFLEARGYEVQYIGLAKYRVTRKRTMEYLEESEMFQLVGTITAKEEARAAKAEAASKRRRTRPRLRRGRQKGKN